MERHGPHDKSGCGNGKISPERYQRIRSLFESAADLPPDRQLGWLREACEGDSELYNHVEGLLREDRATNEESLSQYLPVNEQQPESILQEGTRIGSYQVLREIGRGGMSIVYLAKRADDLFSKQVALKVLRPEKRDAELDRRFHRECDIVARLEHPNIARILDAGATEEGMPYAVMEYVEGKPIDAYCDSCRLNVTERLKLVRTVCAAVQYAHQNLVIHRDLKPSNILVSNDGIVKLLDFGIAKLISHETENVQTTVSNGIQVMTPAYASPEQTTSQPISTSTDVYSLGVLLYELVTGCSPYRTKGKPLHEVIRAICQQEPLRPSEIVLRHDESDQPAHEQLSDVREGKPVKLSRRLKGDLDNITLKALRKEPQRRYSTVEQLGEDLTRHLSGLPVLAQKDTMRYRSAKFVQRHRFGVSSVMAFVLLMCMAVISTTRQAHIAQQQSKRAEEEAARAERERKRAEGEAARAERKSAEAEDYRKKAESETANAKYQLRIAQESNAEAKAKDQEARQEREKAVRSADQVNSMSDSFGAFRLAEISFEKNDLAKAEKSFALALKGDRNPQWIETWCYIYLGKISDIWGRRDNAIDYYTKAVNTREDYGGALDEAQKWLVSPFSRTEYKAEINNPKKLTYQEETLEQTTKGVAAPLVKELKSAKPEFAPASGHTPERTPQIPQSQPNTLSIKEVRPVVADQLANFSGTWRLDAKLSDTKPKCSQGGRSAVCTWPERIYSILVIQQAENKVQITYKEPDWVEEYIKLDVEDNITLGKDKARLSKQKLTVETREISAGFASNVYTNRKREYSLSKDGKTMTLKISTRSIGPPAADVRGINDDTYMDMNLVYNLERAEADHR